MRSYWASSGLAARNGLAAPLLVDVPAVSTWLAKDKAPLALAFAGGPSDDDYFVGDDPKVQDTRNWQTEEIEGGGHVREAYIMVTPAPLLRCRVCPSPLLPGRRQQENEAGLLRARQRCAQSATRPCRKSPPATLWKVLAQPFPVLLHLLFHVCPLAGPIFRPIFRPLLFLVFLRGRGQVGLLASSTRSRPPYAPPLSTIRAIAFPASTWRERPMAGPGRRRPWRRTSRRTS